MEERAVRRGGSGEGRAQREGRAEAAHSRTPYPAAFDGYRGLIILAIVVSHITRWNGWTAPGLARPIRESAFFTIEFLFVVSGFLLFLPVVAKGGFGSWSAYALRRATRIIPAYLIALVATVIFVAARGHPPLPLGDIETFLAHLGFVQHMYGVSGYGVNAVFWVLTIIVFFYALLPFIANPYLRHPFLGLAAAVVTVVAWRALLRDDGAYLVFIQFPLFVADFAIGMTAAWLFVRAWRSPARARLARAAPAVALIGAVALVAMLYAVGDQRIAGEVLYFDESTWLALAIPTAFVVAMFATAFLPGKAQWPFSNRGVRWLGTVSYGVFLYHILVLRLAVLAFGFERDQSAATVVVLAAIVIPVSLLLGWLSYRFVEEPLRVWARSLRSRSRERPEPASSPA